MPDFTPGPWEARMLSDSAEIVSPPANDALVSDCYAGTSYTKHGGYVKTVDECHANARLIAAAPAMYEALKRIQGMAAQSIDLDVDIYTHQIEADSRAALALAEGDDDG